MILGEKEMVSKKDKIAILEENLKRLESENLELKEQLEFERRKPKVEEEKLKELILDFEAKREEYNNLVASARKKEKEYQKKVTEIKGMKKDYKKEMSTLLSYMKKSAR